MLEENQKYVIAGILIVLAGTTFVLSNQGNTSSSVQNSTSWQEIQLQDVSTGENFTIAEMEKPVLVETFAVWCPTCTRQQQEIKKLHENTDTDIRSVSLDVDPNEDQNKVRNHINRYGFDWRYAVAPSKLTRSLISEYGNSIAHPPSAPAVLVCENGTRRLPNGVKPVSKLQEEIQKGC